ncbi:MAG: PilZ domain-containing protein [Blastocatellia bacterium]
MVTLPDMLRTAVNPSSFSSFSSLSSFQLETRKHKRLPLKVTLFLRSLNNHLSYSKKVETINVSDKGLLISSDIALIERMLLEVTSASRRVTVLAEVRHSSYDSSAKKHLIGLAIVEKKTSWLVREDLPQTLSLSLPTLNQDILATNLTNATNRTTSTRAIC